MRIVVACAGHAAPHAGWAAIDELADLLVHYLGAELIAPRRAAPGWVQRLRGGGAPAWEPLEHPGGDVLIVVAHAPQDLSMIEAIPDCRRKFQRIVAWVTDSYFQAGFGRATALYDVITVTAHEDAALPRARHGVAVHTVTQGVDGLAWAPPLLSWDGAARSIDLIGFGRMPPSYHAHFQSRFHPAQSPHLYLHSPLGNVTGPSVHLERGMLFKLLHRTRVSLAFHLYVEPQGERPRSMMVTSRWLESLLAGCVVAGKRPQSRMADEMLGWPGATVELADDPRTAGEQLEALMRQGDALSEQGRRNTREVLQRHDWRRRIGELCAHFGLPRPAALDEDLERVDALAARCV
jgi:Glycosyl transferases group 1